MKINRTFCLDVDVARELRKRSNQSYLVNRLLKQYLFDDLVAPKITECSTNQIAAALHGRCEDETLKAVLHAFISSNRDAKL
jgi:hypothetical protein